MLTVKKPAENIGGLFLTYFLAATRCVATTFAYEACT